jgi:AAA domain/DnaB-like helicase N terminal domain
VGRVSRHASVSVLDSADPPHDTKAEEGVLGSMMLSATAVADVSEIISAADYYRPAHQAVHAAIVLLAGRGEPHDAIAVRAELERQGELRGSLDAPYLHTLIAAVPTPANAAHYARIVLNRSRRRKMAEIAARLLQQAHGADVDLDAALADIEAELAGLAATSSSPRLGELRGALLDSDALDGLPAPEPLIDGVLYRDSLAWLHGKPGHGKSFVALDWAGCIATGLPWQDSPVTQGPVLYVIAEGVSGLRQRVRAWEDYTGQRIGVRFLPVAVQLLNASDIEAVILLAAELMPVLIVIDTQARVTVGGDENSAKDMGELIAAADRIRQASRACVLLVHHEARAGENMRGSTALEGAAATLVRVTKDGPQLQIDNTKQKDSPAFDTIRLRLAPRLDSAVCMPLDGFAMAAELTDSEQKIVDTLRDSFGDVSVPPTKLLEVCKVPKTSFYRGVRQLVASERLVNVGTRKRPQYLLPEFADAADEG